MKKWKQYLKESQSKILNEFNKKDETLVMDDESLFTVAFEIEMETEGSGDDDDYDDDRYEAMQDARVEAAREYYGYDAEESFREDVYGNLTPEDVGMEEPDDGAEMLEWYYDNTSTNPSQFEIIHVALAYQGESDAEDVFDEAIEKVLIDPMPFLKMVYGDSTRIAELQELLGWSDDQITMGFEIEGGKQFPETLEKIGASRPAMLKIIDYYLINQRSLAGRGGPGNIFPKSKKPVDMEKFVNTFSSQNMQWFAETGHEALDSDVDDIKGGYGYHQIQTIVDEINSSNIKYWSQKIMSRYRSEVEEKADEAVQGKYEEFERDPVQHLEDIGYEEYHWFDEDEWLQNYRDSGGGGGGEYGCDVDSLKEALEENFPNFMSKYENNLKFEEDGSLSCGIEFSQDNPLYMVGLSTAIEYLEDFFEEYDAQDYFKMTDSTGLHTNVGYLNEEGSPSEDYNLFKALMFLNHRYATTGVGFPSRERSHWAQDLKEPAVNNIMKFIERLPENSSHEDVLTKDSFMKKYLSRNFEELSAILTNQVGIQANRMGAKSLGFNVVYTSRRNYIEFRYPGRNDVNLESMTKALKYYAFIVKAAADPNFKKKEYIKDLIGFINNIQGEKPSISKLKFIKEIKKGDMILNRAAYANNFKKILIFNMIQAVELNDQGLEDAGESVGSERTASIAYKARSVVANVVDNMPHKYGALFNNTNPAIYKGVVKGPSVLLDRMVFLEGEPLGVKFFTEKLSAKSFQNELNESTYSRADDIDIYKKLMMLLIESKNSIEFSQKFIKLVKIPDPLPDWGLKWRDESSKENAQSAAGAEDGAVTDQLVDMTMDMMSEDKEMEEIKNHFKNWKF